MHVHRSFYALAALFFCNTVQAQADNSSVEIKAAEVYTIKDSVTFLYGNVSLNAGRINVRDADSVIINQTNNKLVFKGQCKIEFDGKVVVTKGAAHKRMEYVLGEDAVYLYQ